MLFRVVGIWHHLTSVSLFTKLLPACMGANSPVVVCTTSKHHVLHGRDHDSRVEDSDPLKNGLGVDSYELTDALRGVDPS